MAQNKSPTSGLTFKLIIFRDFIKTFHQQVLVFVGLLIYFGAIAVFTDRLSGNDSYFHIKYAWLLWTEGRLWDFPWLQGTLFRDVWVDHEFLFHILLIPFVWLGELYLAAKTAFVFWAALAFFSFYLLIRQFGKEDDAWCRFSWIWSIILAASSHSMLYRLGHTRVQALSLLFMIIAIILVEKERHRWLLPLGFLYSWLYNGSIILIPLMALYSLSRLVIDRILVCRPILYASAGVSLGFVLNPYFPGNLSFLWRHLMEYLIRPTPVPVSSEWLNYPTWHLFGSSQGAWFFLFLGVFVMGFQRCRISRRSLYFLLVNTLMLLLVFRARRFVEYWPVFAVLFSASVFQDSYRTLMNEEMSILSEASRKTMRTVVVAMMSGMMVSASIAAGINAWRTIKSIQAEAPLDRFAGASRWLAVHTTKGTIVFNSRWDTFPELFYHNHHNYWIAGLNEAFTYYLDLNLWKTYESIAKGELPNMALHIQKDFRAAYVVALKIEKELLVAARKPENGLEKVWEDEMTIIYQVRPFGGALR